MSMIRKNMEITLKTDPNLADLLLQGCRQIIEQLADEFNLDKSTIELGKTFDRETQTVGKLGKIYTISTIKYNNYYLAVAFGLYSRGIQYQSPLMKESNGWGCVDSRSTPGDDIDIYTGFCIYTVFLKNKDDNFLTTEYQTLPYNTYYVDTTSNKNIFNFNFYYLKNSTTNDIFIYSGSYHSLNSLIQSAIVTINNKNYIVKPNFIITSINEEDDEIYSLSPSYGVISGQFGNTFSKDNIVYSFILPCYAANEAGTVSYLYNSVDFLYKTIGNFTLGQEYIINGTLYVCIGLVGNNGLLVNTQLTYGEIKGEYE